MPPRSWLPGLALTPPPRCDVCVAMHHSYVAFGNETMWDMFQTLYQGLRKHSLQANGWYADVSLHGGKVVRAHAEALGAAWCGIEVGAGYVADAAWCTNAHHRVRHEVGYLSENFDVTRWKVSVAAARRVRACAVSSMCVVCAPPARM